MVAPRCRTPTGTVVRRAGGTRVRPDLARALAAGFLAAADAPAGWARPALVDAGADVLGRRARWLGPLARQVLELYPRPPLDRPRELADVIRSRPAAERAGRSRPLRQPVTGTRMVSNPWRLPELHDLADLAALLGLTPAGLDLFTDPRRWARTAPEPVQHYRHGHRFAPSGAVRVLEAPKPRLKAVQRRLLGQVLGRIPPHDAAHGFRRGRGVGSHAAVHAGQQVVLRLDLEGFFAAVGVGRVHGIWRQAGYPEPVAYALTGLTTTVLPLAAWRAVPRPVDPDLLDAHWRLGRRLAGPHLPQGAPTSPALANLAAFGLDVRLTALAGSWGGRYSRYADDLAFSGPRGWGRGTSRILDLVADVVRDEGFRLNERKTAVLPRAGRQQLGGLVVNDRPRVARAEVDRLRAVLHNCARHGPSSQNRDGVPDLRRHLAGRVAWVAQHDPGRGARLHEQLAAIDWTR